MTATGDRDYFAAQAGRLMDRMYGTALRYTRAASDAEDLVGETLLKAWNGLSQLEDRDRFDGWIMRILSNTFLSRARRDKLHQSLFEADVSVDDLDDTDALYARLHQPFLLWYGSPEKAFVNNLLNEDIERALDALSDAHRVVVVMVELLGFSYEEVATSLEVPVGTVRSRLNRARKQLQQTLWNNARDAGLVSGTLDTERGTAQ